MPTKTELRLALHNFIDAWLEAGVDLEMVIEVVDDEVKFQVIKRMVAKLKKEGS